MGLICQHNLHEIFILQQFHSILSTIWKDFYLSSENGRLPRVYYIVLLPVISLALKVTLISLMDVEVAFDGSLRSPISWE